MEQNQNISSLLAQLEHPAFLVQDKVITEVNPAAQKRMISVGTHVEPMLLTGKKEYDSFTEGRLLLTMKISNTEYQATVIRTADAEIFSLMENEEPPEVLRILSLSGQELRKPLSEVFALAGQVLSTVENQQKAQQLNQYLFQLHRIVCNMTDAGRSLNRYHGRLQIQNVTSLFAEIFEKAAQQLDRTEMTLQFTNLKHPVICMVDLERLERGVYNIIANAMKFSNRNGIIRAVLQQKGNWLYLTVINPVASNFVVPRSDLFTRYLREPGVEDSRFGIGLGMVMIQAAARAHNGTVLIEHPKESEMKLTITLQINKSSGTTVFESPIRVDYAGEQDHCLLELSESLPASCYAIHPLEESRDGS